MSGYFATGFTVSVLYRNKSAHASRSRGKQMHGGFWKALSLSSPLLMCHLS